MDSIPEQDFLPHSIIGTCPTSSTATAYPSPDVDKLLKARLKRARLILGLVEETVPTFLLSNPAPIGFISIDVDYYTSTADVFKALECDRGAPHAPYPLLFR